MIVIITLAGHSRRFKKEGYSVPKFLIEIDGSAIIHHVLNMYADDDEYHLIINDNQALEYPNLELQLKKIKKNIHIHAIESHENGPVYSVYMIKEKIKSDQPIIISYCDFLVDWDYEKFKREAYNYDGAIPCFKGFHPASFGKTLYAYVKKNKFNLLTDLREKKNFTNNRLDEDANTGIYYFKNITIFSKYAEKFFRDIKYQNKEIEGYVSLLYPLMLEKEHKILITDVEKFICLGTPEDLEQYLYWSKIFKIKTSKKIKDPNQVNLIPMAGKGQRFFEAGFKVSKPLILIDNIPMIKKACNSFPEPGKWVFVSRKEHNKFNRLTSQFNEITNNFNNISLDHETKGMADSCLKAYDEIDKKNSVFIASCDYEMQYNDIEFNNLKKNKNIDGIIFTIKLGNNLTKNPEAFAYCKVNNNVVTEIKEKEVISNKPGNDHLIVGSFWFRTSDLLYECINKAIEKKYMINNEYYIGNSINLLIAEGKNFVIFEIDRWISYGDPFELDLYFYWNKWFTK